MVVTALAIVEPPLGRHVVAQSHRYVAIVEVLLANALSSSEKASSLSDPLIDTSSSANMPSIPSAVVGLHVLAAAHCLAASISAVVKGNKRALVSNSAATDTKR